MSRKLSESTRRSSQAFIRNSPVCRDAQRLSFSRDAIAFCTLLGAVAMNGSMPGLSGIIIQPAASRVLHCLLAPFLYVPAISASSLTDFGFFKRIIKYKYFAIGSRLLSSTRSAGIDTLIRLLGIERTSQNRHRLTYYNI